MARMGPKILLGFEDESISDKYKSSINYTTNKIGGKPNWPVEGVASPLCQLCGLTLPLVLQIYAPLENNPYHRTLYLFGCINPNCWNQNESWVCVRSQTLETREEKEADTLTTVNTMNATDWCVDADDWEDENNANNNEENGNVIEVGRIGSCADVYSEDEDETEDFEDDSALSRFGNLQVGEDNANWNNGSFGKAGAGAQAAGAVGCLRSPSATAEIEGDESEVVSIDTPTVPQHDLIALLQEVTPLPLELCSSDYTDKNGCVVTSKAAAPQFAAFFVNVGEENQDATANSSQEHIRELIHEYQQNTKEDLSLSPDQDKRLGAGHGDNPTLEKYEKGVPAHGDWMFHEFLSRIQANPGQIVRYCRDGSPLLLAPLHGPPSRCQHCRGETVFELQLLPTLIAKLALAGQTSPGASHLEFGSVLVFTCQRSCWATNDTVRQEAVVVQVEQM